PIASRFRGEVKKVKSVIRIVQHFKEIIETDSDVTIVTDSDVYWQGKHVARTENIAFVIEEIKDELRP
ncbi:MAG: hypothetical protein LBH09_00340, partial [Peptococcaceae bacterium]|nr:hypothetical protein [Peptococcaceae bacterium]